MNPLAVFVTMAATSLASAQATNDSPSLHLTLEKPMVVKAGGGEIRFTGPFAKAPDGRSGLAVGSTQDLPRIPAAKFVGENGTIIFTFINKPRSRLRQKRSGHPCPDG